MPLYFAIISEIIFIMKHIKKNPHNDPVINLRQLFEIQIFFNCNMPSIPNINIDKNANKNNFIRLYFNNELEKIIPIIYPINNPEQRAQIGN